nr:MetaGeneMark_Unknown Function [uncultured bacterium]
MPVRAEVGSTPEEVGSAEPSSLPPAVRAGADFPAPLAAQLDRLKLRGVAEFLLDIGRPFGWLGAQLVLVAQPTLSIFGADKSSREIADWLEQLDDNEGKRP